MESADIKMIGPAEAGRIIGYHRTHVLRLIKAGEIPAQKTSIGHIMDRDAIERLAAEWRLHLRG